MLRNINWRYALGEIIIVIIGISIAFGLNNWAANTKDNRIKKQYIESLLDDIENERDQLAENIAEFEEMITTVRSLFPYLYGRTDGRDSMSQKVFSLATIVQFHPNDVTYKTLINSGDLALFDDFELKKELENHYSDQALIEQDYSRQNNIHERYFGDFMIHNMDYQKLGQGDYSFMDEPMLRNIIQSLYGSYSIAIASSQAGMERCEVLHQHLSTTLQGM